jgi:hypothetical protein
MLDYRAMNEFCDRCDGRHTTQLHFPRKIAASALGRNYALEDAAGVARMPVATVQYWLDNDQEFQRLVSRARIRAIKRVARHAGRVAKILADTS